jgi:hypothetical protein
MFGSHGFLSRLTGTQKIGINGINRSDGTTKFLIPRAGDRDRTRDVQLGKSDVN